MQSTSGEGKRREFIADTNEMSSVAKDEKEKKETSLDDFQSFFKTSKKPGRRRRRRRCRRRRSFRKFTKEFFLIGAKSPTLLANVRVKATVELQFH